MRLEDVPVLTEILLEQYGLRDWHFAWGRGRNTFGTCVYRRKEIRISKPLAELNTEERVEETIRHEIAHALAGPRAHHGWAWRAQCRVVGIEPKRCFSTANTIVPERPPRKVTPPKWAAVCVTPGCGFVAPVRRLSRDIRLGVRWYRCPRCPGARLDIVRQSDGRLEVSPILEAENRKRALMHWTERL